LPLAFSDGSSAGDCSGHASRRAAKNVVPRTAAAMPMASPGPAAPEGNDSWYRKNPARIGPVVSTAVMAATTDAAFARWNPACTRASAMMTGA